MKSSWIDVLIVAAVITVVLIGTSAPGITKDEPLQSRLTATAWTLAARVNDKTDADLQVELENLVLSPRLFAHDGYIIRFCDDIDKWGRLDAGIATHDDVLISVSSIEHPNEVDRFRGDGQWTRD